MEGVDYVLNANALKQVPFFDFIPQAFIPNVIGIENELNCAIGVDGEEVVVFNTDKVANSINAKEESYHRESSYNKFLIEGESNVSDREGYTSHITTRRNLAQVKPLLLKLKFVRNSLDA